MNLLESYFTEYMPYAAGLSENTILSYKYSRVFGKTPPETDYCCTTGSRRSVTSESLLPRFSTTSDAVYQRGPVSVPPAA